MDDASLHVLCAFPYASTRVLRMMEQHADRLTVLIDSGAFTAWKAGTTIALSEYEAFLRKLPLHPWAYITLDVVGDAAATRANLQAMLDHGLSPMPVFTRGESIDEAMRLLEQHSRVALGGVAGTGQDPRPYLLHLQHQLGGLGRCHVLGFTSADWLKHLRPESADCSSWEAARRYGQVAVYLGHGRMWRGDRISLAKAPREVWSRARMVGYDLAQLRDQQQWRGGKSLAAQITTTSYAWLSADLRRNMGTRLFYGFTTDMALQLLLDAHARLIDYGLVTHQRRIAS